MENKKKTQHFSVCWESNYSILTEEIFISSLIYTIYVDLEINKEVDNLSMLSVG